MEASRPSKHSAGQVPTAPVSRSKKETHVSFYVGGARASSSRVFPESACLSVDQASGWIGGGCLRRPWRRRAGKHVHRRQHILHHVSGEGGGAESSRIGRFVPY